MPIPHQKSIVGVLWCLAIADAVRQGISLPQSEFVMLTSAAHQFNPAIAVFGLVAPPVCVLLTVAFPLSAKAGHFSRGWVSRWVDRRWGAGSAHAFLRQLRPAALVGAVAFVLGCVGFVSSMRSNASSFAFEVASFFVAAGFGFCIARAMAMRLLPDEPWV